MYILLNYSLGLADLCADPAADALSMVYHALAVSYGNCGAAQLQAHLAADALVFVHLKGRIVLDIFKKCAGTAGDDNGSLGSGKLLLDGSFCLSQVIWVNNPYTPDSHSLAKLFKVNGSSRVALKVLACCGVLLMTCHTCN